MEALTLGGFGSLLGGLGSIYSGYNQQKIAKDMFNFEKSSYLDRKRTEEERRKSLGSFGAGLYGGV